MGGTNNCRILSQVASELNINSSIKLLFFSSLAVPSYPSSSVHYFNDSALNTRPGVLIHARSTRVHVGVSVFPLMPMYVFKGRQIFLVVKLNTRKHVKWFINNLELPDCIRKGINLCGKCNQPFLLENKSVLLVNEKCHKLGARFRRVRVYQQLPTTQESQTHILPQQDTRSHNELKLGRQR